MSYFDEASLVLVPSGYKNQKIYSIKPLDGSGDLTFSRASSATRVASNGLIEKVRTNLLLQSNTFTNATWDKLGVTVTAGQAGYDGTNNATLITVTSAFPRLQQNIANTGLQTLSVYAKAGAYNYLFINSLQNGSGDNASFDLVAGTQIVSFTTQVSSSITSVGNGWWKIVISFSNTTFGSIAFGTSIDGTVPAWSTASAGSVLIQDAQIEVGDIATAYIPTTSAAVSVGPVSGLPRLDYLNSTCPRLLLEPQRSNLMLYSEQFNNAAWSKNATTITANAATSPDGYTNADKLIVDNGASLSSISNYALQSITKAASAIQYTYSIFAKQGGLNRVNIIAQGASFANNASATFSLVNGTITTAATAAGAFTGASASVSDYGNGWYRCTLVFTTNTDTDLIIRNIPTDSTLTTGNGTNGILIYGAQLEAGAYATSYIPTLGASVTRVADAAFKASISSLLSGSVGTLFLEIERQGPSGGDPENVIFTSDTSLSNFVNIVYDPTTNRYRAQVREGGTTTGIVAATSAYTGKIKIAAAWAANDLVLYINGVLQATDTSVTVPTATFNSLGLGSYYDGTYGSDAFRGSFSQALVFKTRLTNSQLAELTA